jgi:hypothetical protein
MYPSIATFLEKKSRLTWVLLCFFCLLLPVSELHTQSLRSDFDDNGAVNFTDFILSAQAFGGSDSRFDLGGNGKVDFEDFVLFASDYGSNTTVVWTQLEVANTGPTARFDHTLILDPARRQLVLFGGKATNPLGDTWILDLDELVWREVPTESSPEARRGHTAILDPVGDRMLVFGGEPASRVFFNDVWEFNLKTETWRERSPSGERPVPRYGTSAIYDPVRNRMIVSHGFSSQGRFDDTWSFDLATHKWTDLTPPEPKPLKRCLHDAVYDTVNDRMLLGGGCSSGFGPCPQDDIWAFDLSTQRWTQLQFEADHPGPLRNQALLFEPSGKRMVLFGGAESRAKSDTWSLDVSDDIWELISFQGQVPDARWSHKMVLDSARRRVLMWGGTSGSPVFDDLWELTF